MAAKPKLAFRAGASVRFLDGNGETQHGVIDHVEPGDLRGDHALRGALHDRGRAVHRVARGPRTVERDVTHRGIVLVTGGETYRVRDGRVRLSLGALDACVDQVDWRPGVGKAIPHFDGLPIRRSRWSPFGQVLKLRDLDHGGDVLVVGLAHPELAP